MAVDYRSTRRWKNVSSTAWTPKTGEALPDDGYGWRFPSGCLDRDMIADSFLQRPMVERSLRSIMQSWTSWSVSITFDHCRYVHPGKTLTLFPIGGTHLNSAIVRFLLSSRVIDVRSLSSIIAGRRPLRAIITFDHATPEALLCDHCVRPLQCPRSKIHLARSTTSCFVHPTKNAFYVGNVSRDHARPQSISRQLYQRQCTSTFDHQTMSFIACGCQI